MDRHGSARARIRWRRPGLCAAIFGLLLPASAGAQRDQFIDAFIEFHSEISGTYGDEGPRAAAALDRMAAALDAWNAATRQAEARLKSAPDYAPSTVALLFLDAGRLSDALNAIDSALQLEPPRAGLHMFRGLLLDAAGRPAEAIRSFATAWQLDPDDPISAYLLADRTAAAETAPELGPQIASLLAAQAAGAVRPLAPFLQVTLIDDGAAEMPRFAPAAYADGFVAFAQGRYEDAIAHFRAVMSKDPLVADPIGRSDGVTQGATALRKGQVADAVALLEAAAAQHPSSPEAHRVLGVAHAVAGNVEASLEHLTAAIRLAHADERALVALGRVLMQARRMDEAERALRDALALLPASGRTRWALADLYEQTGRGTDVIAQLEEAAALPVPAGRGPLLWRLGGMANRLHDYERIVSALARRTRLMPNDASAHRSLGLAYHRAGRDGPALIELLLSSLMGLEDAEMLTVIGRMHLNAGRADTAEKVLRRAVMLDDRSAEARYALGRTLMQLNRTVEGQEQLAEFNKLRLAQIAEQRRLLEIELLQHTNDLAPTKPKE